MAEALSREDRLSLIRELKTGLSNKDKTHSIMELCGLGAEIWEGIDAQEYVSEERASWER